ncbi:uncharacterized protein EI90DRAFT_180994 [Cantharellus anzutake]|uniref:uncharacterized protein n=1 Tax=Cantharellus anzutake TaxID=1750568 RepID=UPI0019064DF0|nr:uncharacterized protein EI90DRAFT_180994 [Cantharellus anzutake]KAF8336487.1 hypothetical protein EI90DRAFT_180994 [Cantharellus anzutake]
MPLHEPIALGMTLGVELAQEQLDLHRWAAELRTDDLVMPCIRGGGGWFGEMWRGNAAHQVDRGTMAVEQLRMDAWRSSAGSERRSEIYGSCPGAIISEIIAEGEVMVTSEPIRSLDLSSTSCPERSLGNAKGRRVLSCNDEVITENPIYGSENDKVFFFNYVKGYFLCLRMPSWASATMLLGWFDSDVMSFSDRIAIHSSSERSSRGNARDPNFGTVIQLSNLYRSLFPFTPSSSPFYQLYGHLSDPVRVFTVSSDCSGHNSVE